MNKVIYKYNTNTTLTFTDLDEGGKKGGVCRSERKRNNR